MEEHNAIIKYTQLGYVDRGFTLVLGLDYGGAGQGAGCRSLGGANGEGTALGHQMIIDVLKTVGVGMWEDLKGEHVRVKSDHSKVYEIGHILEDKWMEM